VECQTATDRFEREWRAYLTEDEDGERVEVVVRCPARSRREFADDEWPLR
jgi:hypothetical protein